MVVSRICTPVPKGNEWLMKKCLSRGETFRGLHSTNQLVVFTITVNLLFLKRGEKGSPATEEVDQGCVYASDQT